MGILVKKNTLLHAFIPVLLLLEVLLVDIIAATAGTSDGDDATSQEPKEEKAKGSSDQMILACSFGGVMVLIILWFSWPNLVECWRRPSRNAHHRAFIKYSRSGWTCPICYHSNDQVQVACVLCGSASNGTFVVQQPPRESRVSASSSGSVFHLLTTPRRSVLRSQRSNSSSTSSRSEVGLNERQQVAMDRHSWKRCIGPRGVYWMRIPVATFQTNLKLRGTIVVEKHLRAQNPSKSESRCCCYGSSSSEAIKEGSFISTNTFPFKHDQPQITVFNEKTAFVRDDFTEAKTKWRRAEEVSISVRKYSSDIQKVAYMPFHEKVQWMFQYSEKLSSSIVEGFHTIRVHREHVVKQSFHLFMTAPSTTLRRRLRVDFMEEPGIDGGGILREWLHLICNEIFSDGLGLFQQTNSSTHQGYWVNRNASKTCRNHLQMFQFFGKILGKTILEGLLLNIRLSIPLLKHILGAPLCLSDLRLIDETIHASLMWILKNDNTDVLSLTFAVDGYDLIPNGSEVAVDDTNKHFYVEKVMQYYLFDSVQSELASILEGVRSVISDTMLHAFDYKELDLLLSGLPDIDVDDWKAHTDVRFLGENLEREIEFIGWFWEIVESFTQDARSRLLQYVTGSSGVPVEGFKGLTGMDGEIQPFTIQLGKAVSQIYTVLPHASTCVNRLDLRVYSSKEELEEILLMVIQMDVTGFNSR